MDLLAEYCDEMLVMVNGELIAKGDTRTVLSDPLLVEKNVQIPQVVQLAEALEKAGKPLPSIPVNDG